MATKTWAQAVSGTWTTAADWTGGVPHHHDTAVIDAVSHKTKYTVTVDTPVSVGTLVLDAATATLLVENTLTTNDLVLEAGTVLLDNGTLAGTVTSSGVSLKLASSTDDTLHDVTWQGGLHDFGKDSTLTISGGLTLTGAGGTGPGTATFDTNVVLSGVTTLNDATISTIIGTIEVSDTATLTLGSQLTLDYDLLKVDPGVMLANEGVLDNVTVSGGTLTNTGTIEGSNDLAAKSFTNDGLIAVSGGQLTLSTQGLQAAGAEGVIDIGDNGVLILAGTLTTAALNTLFTQQHVSGSGNFGTGITGALNNAGDTLDIGTGSRFGAFDAAGGTITGGTVIDGGGDSFFGTLSTLTLQSQTSTLTTGFSATLNDVTVTGATVLSGDGLVCNGGTLSGVGTVSLTDAAQVDPNVELNGVDITGANNSGAVTILVNDMIEGVTLTAAQSVAGYTFDLTGYSDLLVYGGAVLDGAHVTFDSPGLDDYLFVGDYGQTANVALGTTFITAVTSGTDLIIDARDQDVAPVLQAAGTFSVSGTLQVGAANTYANLNNTGAIDVVAGGTFLVQANPDTIITNAGTIAAASGVIDIATSFANTGLVSDVFGGSASTATIGGKITGAGTIALSGPGTLALGSTVAAGQVVQMGIGAEALDLTSAAASKGFAGTLDGFTQGDSVVLGGETVSSAQFSGASIIASLSSGGSIVLDTGVALHGTLAVSEQSGNATLTYASGTPSLNDWTASELNRDEAQAMPAPHEMSGGLPRYEILALDQLLLHRPWH